MVSQAGLFATATCLFVIAAILARKSATHPASYRHFQIAWGVILVGFLAYAIFSYLSIQDVISNDPALAQEMGLDESSGSRGLLAIGLTLLTGIYLWLFVTNHHVRRVLLWAFPPASDEQPDYQNIPWEQQISGFDNRRVIHLYAAGLAQLFFFQTFIDFIIAGGQTGLATIEFSQPEIVLSSILTAGMLLAVVGAGVGLGQDQTPSQVGLRLGLRWPGFTELMAGIGIAVILLAFQLGAGIVWFLLVPEEVFNQQTQVSQAISGSVTSMVAALLVALFSSVGEEVAFRGALQPVMGLWPTAILFALIHIQYQLTPATLIILVVGLLLGLTRKYFGTVAAITTHFFYNFTLLTIAVLANHFQDVLEPLMESGLLLR
ncbi:CPBP family intramembrane glutamic endopeptidase [Chloroflexota bacterium]